MRQIINGIQDKTNPVSAIHVDSDGIDVIWSGKNQHYHPTAWDNKTVDEIVSMVVADYVLMD